LQGCGDDLNETKIGQEVFHRGEDFDPLVDTIVRVEGSRLRVRLRGYYETEGCDDAIRIELPVGQYDPVFIKAAPVAIAVAPASPSIALGKTLQFTATASYSDNSTQDLTSSVTWSSSSAEVAIMNADGLATSMSQGNATITAASGSVRGSTTLSVSAPALVSIALAPAASSIPLGSTQQLTAAGTYTDNSTHDLTSSVIWSSSASEVAKVNAAGMATSISPGNTTISGTSGSVSGSTTVTIVAPALVSITLSPANPSVRRSKTQQLTATGTYTDNSTQDLTASADWISSAAGVATINAGGLVKGVYPGIATMTAISGSISGSTSLTVPPRPNLRKLFITPAVVLAVCASIVYLISRNWPSERSVAVLPFHIIEDDSQNQSPCDGLFWRLTARLSELEPFQSSFWVQDAANVCESGIRSATQAFRTFGVNLAVTGSIQRRKETAVVTVNVVAARTGKHLGVKTLLVSSSGSNTLDEQVAEAVIAMLKLNLPPATTGGHRGSQPPRTSIGKARDTSNVGPKAPRTRQHCSRRPWIRTRITALRIRDSVRLIWKSMNPPRRRIGSTRLK